LTNSSDARLKENIEPIPDALEKIMQIDGVGYNWSKSGAKGLGFIAQDMEKIFPEITTINEKTGYMGIAYNQVIPVLWEAVKELKLRVEKLEGK